MTRDLDWGVPVPVTDAAEGKYCMFGLMHQLDTFLQQKNLRPNDWELYWKDKEHD